MAKPPHPNTAAERQAVLVMETAYEVAAGIEARRASLKSSTLPDEARRRARAELVEASERLVNLVILASRRLSSDLGGEIGEMVDRGMDELRQRLLATGTGLVIDRADKIKAKALSVVDGGADCPLGLAPRLAEILGSVEATVGALGGLAILPEHDRAKVEEARQAVGRLAAFEAKMAVLTDLDD